MLIIGFYQQLLGNGLSKTKALQEAQKAMILGKVQVTDVAESTDRAELSIDGNKVTSSDYGQKTHLKLQRLVVSICTRSDIIKYSY